MSIAGKVIGYLGSVFSLYPRSGGGIVVRQPGGVAGTDEVQISHSGTSVIVRSMDDSSIVFQGSGGTTKCSVAGLAATGSFTCNDSSGEFNFSANSRRFYSGGLDLLNTDSVLWRASSFGSVDTGLTRAAAGVTKFTNGSTAGKTFSSPVLTPTQITANQDDYAPGVAMHYRLSSDASRDITGLSVGQVDGQVCEIWNIGSNNIVLKHDVTSTAANRFLCVGSADLTLLPNDIALLRYDPTSQRWRVGKL